MNDESKAISDVAKTVGKGIDACREVGSFIAEYTGESIEQAIGIFEDKLKYIRWERQIRLIERANLFLIERGLESPTRKVPLKIAIPLLQAASLEDDDKHQDRWAALLANAADSNCETEIRRSFISILEDLSPLDASNLEAIYSHDKLPFSEIGLWTKYLPNRVIDYHPSEEDICPPKDVLISLGNLLRQGLISSSMFMNAGNGELACIARTTLGNEFMLAMTNPNPENK